MEAFSRRKWRRHPIRLNSYLTGAENGQARRSDHPSPHQHRSRRRRRLQHEARAMQGQGGGSSSNIAWAYGQEGAAGASVYVGSKHAVEGITKSVALETATSGIRVTAVAPAPTDAGMLTRFTGTPENKADL